MIENCVSPEVYTGIQSLGLLLLSLRFTHEQKQVIKDRFDGRCAETGRSKKIEVHHRVCCTLGGSDSLENGVPLTESVHKEWDRRALEEGIIYPGIPIPEAPVELFVSPQAKERIVYKFKKMGVL